MPIQRFNLSLKDAVETFTKQLFYALFDDACEGKSLKLKKQFLAILNALQIEQADQKWSAYRSYFCSIRDALDQDAKAFESTDPACKDLQEVYLAYPGFHAIAIYRLSNRLYQMNIPILPRMMSEYGHSITGTDIHPGATIGESFFIDHATGIVIGETTVIKNHVKIYQGVTLGGIQVKKELASVKRHPTIEDYVIIYANATVLGGDVTVGKNSIIGANVCITQSVPENSLVIYKSENKIIQRES